MKKDLITPLSINMPKQESYESFMDEFTIDNMGVDSLGIEKFQSDFKLRYEETVDEFIFSRIEPFVDSLSTTKIPKRELIEAVQLINLKKEALEKYGCASISNDWETAAEQSIELQRAYLKGLNDGYQKAVEEAREFYQGKEKSYGKEEN